MRWLTIVFIALTVCLLVGCGQKEPIAETTVPPTQTEMPSDTNTTSEPNAQTSEKPSQSSAVISVPEYEIELVAKTLRGECFDEQHDDKREVVRVICNRVSVGGFGDSIEEVITKPHQFVGYKPDNTPTANDYEIAREILTQWYDGGCVPLSEYLFFSAGGGHKNVFRKDY